LILVFGSLNADVVLTTPVHPKPGETVLCSSSALKVGGKGCNQAVAAARAGAKVKLAGRIGDDALGADILKSLRQELIDTEFVIKTSDIMTGCAAVSVDANGENIIYVAPGANELVRSNDVSDEVLKTASTLICQMEVPAAENWKILERASQFGVKTILNYAPALGADEEVRHAIRSWVDFLVVNLEEAFEIRSSKSDSFDGDVGALARLVASRSKTFAIVTAGAKGAFASNGTMVWHAPSFEVDILDTTGAGDTFTGVFAAMLEEGMVTEEAVRFAAVAGSLACRKLGAQASMPTRAEIQKHAPVTARPRSRA
jgi:ribokinase